MTDTPRPPEPSRPCAYQMPSGDRWCVTHRAEWPASASQCLDAARAAPLDVERLRQCLDGYVGHDSWRCTHPDKGEPLCDFTMEAENIAAEYAALASGSAPAEPRPTREDIEAMIENGEADE